MAITVEQAKALARKHAGSALHEDYYDYGEGRDFATDEVVRPMEVSRREYEQLCKELEQSRAEAEADDSPVELVPAYPSSYAG